MKPDNIIAICEYILDKTRNDIDNRKRQINTVYK